MGQGDAELMQRWQRGDSGAFEEMVRRWQQPIGRFLARYLGQEDPQDLCQEVFLRVFQARATYRPVGSVSAWLYQIALNVARDWSRRQRRRLTTQTLPVEGPEGGAPEADSLLQKQEFAAEVGRAVAELSEPNRLVLILRHYEGLSFEEIARMTQTPASTVKSRFAVAVGRLRQSLQHLEQQEIRQ